MKKYSLIEWKAAGESLYGKDYEKWKFKCPNCELVSSGADFLAVGAEIDDMYSTCIGRHNKKAVGCDWAAFGLFRALGKSNLIINGDKEVEVFQFADEIRNDGEKT